MELRIKITKENKDKIFRLISELLEDSEGSTIDIGDLSITEGKAVSKVNSIEPKSEKATIPQTSCQDDLLKKPKFLQDLKPGIVNLSSHEAKFVGSWGQFNSFQPIKAALRILANKLTAENSRSMQLDRFVEICIGVFKRNELSKYRGFPSSDKDTAKGRFVWHFLTTAYYMGLIDITKQSEYFEGLPDTLNYWEEVSITITKQGLEFARLYSEFFDNSGKQLLSREEKTWLISYLKDLDSKGYKEYSLLRDVYYFLKEGHNGKEDLWRWFQEDRRFNDYVRSWSRKKNDPAKLRKQIENLSKTFAASKVALLREFGVVIDRRNRYGVIGDLE
jgi:hypothetical protein